MPASQTFVILGASLAGAKAAETLRAEGFDGRVVLIGEEPARPYERPPLSKDYLRGEKGFDDAAVHDEGFYDAKAIELHTSTTATALDPGASEVALASGEHIGYDRLLLATGARPRRLTVPGADLPGVYYLRTVADADALRQSITASSRVVVIGAGWIGAEVAASARQLGAEVAMVELASVPLERVLGPEVGAIYRDLHAQHGVELHFGVGVDSLEGGAAVETVRLADGTVLSADVVVVGVGVTPRVELARGAGLALDNGVAVDEHLASSAPGVYAAGDVANAFHPRYGIRIRLEHWSAALNQGPTAARNMLGAPTVYDRMPYFFSDQYDLGMEYRGFAPSWDDVLFRGAPDSGQFIAFWMRQGRVLAAMNANIWDVGEALEALIRAEAPLESARLMDQDVDLSSLAAPPTS
jgi:3-phenylpropionate/trans-cinnamate dioxygenase ferredoxin reductase subunit